MKEIYPSKGNFRNFVEDASQDKALAAKFAEKVKTGIDARGLQDLFYELHYYGVNLDTCETIIKRKQTLKELVQAVEPKY